MKILITSDWYTSAINGVVTSLLNLRAALTAQGHDVRILTLSGDSRTYTEDGVTFIGSIDAGRIYPGARLRGPAVGSAMRSLIAWKPDIVHSQCEFSTFFLAKHIARAVHAPLIHTYHTVYEDYTHYFSPSRRWGRRIAGGLSRFILAQTDCVIAPTEKVRRLLTGYGIEKPIHVIPTGIELSRFSAPIPSAVLAAKKAALGIPAQNRVLVYVGRMAKEKNLEELIACRAQLPEAITLLLVGGGPELESLRTAAAKLPAGAVVFTGMVSPADVPLYYRLGDVFVSASSSETQGLTYLEALASGLPAVCRADECLEGVIENGKNGWQYTGADDRAKALAALVQDDALRHSFSENAAASAQKFSVEAFGRAAAAVYRSQLLSAHREKHIAARKGGVLLWKEI